VTSANPLVDPQALAAPFVAAVRAEVASLPPIRLLGLLATSDRGSQVYCDYTARGCEAVGIRFEQRWLDPEQVSATIFECNADPAVHGVMVYYPIFHGARDRSLQNEVAPEKDVEGLHATWSGRLYHDIRTIDPEGKKKAILPCTPLGIVKALEALKVYDESKGPRKQAEGLTITVFNRSEVVGRPLAAMLAHDGARVLSFDIEGCVLYEGWRSTTTDLDRATALAQSDVVITGVPSRDFPPVRAAELKPGVTCINFSHLNNLADDVAERSKHVLLRVGPITVAMLARNTLRLYRNFHGA
jgi:5,10-methylene-tetrahydrofolate dehydrogenase/methenyl tetrahydrofolate cyclohydrolase